MNDCSATLAEDSRALGRPAGGQGLRLAAPELSIEYLFFAQTAARTRFEQAGALVAALDRKNKRVAFELRGEPMAESLRETKRRTGLSNGTILTARAQLVEAGWAAVDEGSDRNLPASC